MRKIFKFDNKIPDHLLIELKKLVETGDYSVNIIYPELTIPYQLCKGQIIVTITSGRDKEIADEPTIRGNEVKVSNEIGLYKISKVN